MNKPYFWWAVSLPLLASPSAWADQVGGGYPGHHMWGGGWHGWVFGPLMMIIILAVIVALVVLIMRRLGGNNSAKTPEPRAGKEPLDILKERFAKGEIDGEEFDARRHILEK